MSFEIVIHGGRIVDGSSNPWFKANIGIDKGKIIKVSRRPLEAELQIDVTGLIVCPSFIDLHSHSDTTIQIHNKAESFIHMGLTTMGVGQCGSDVYTITEETKPLIKRTLLTRSISAFPDLSPADVGEIDWNHLGEWREKLEKKGISANVIPYVGYGNLRRCAMGVEGAGGERFEPTVSELEEMKQLLELQMQHGAFGMSTGLRYTEQRNAFTEEVIELAKVVSKYGGIYISHMRGEADVLIESTKEIIEICEKAGVPSCISHHKAMFPENWGKVNETIRLLNRARARGLEIYADQYCQLYAREANLGSWFVGHILARDPKSGLPPSVDELLGEIQNSEKWETVKKTVKEAYEQEVAKNEERKKALSKRGVAVPAIWNPATFDYIVHSKTHPDLIGMNFSEAAAAMGYTDFWDAIRDLWIADNGYTYVAAGSMCEEDIITILKDPATTISTDGRATNGKILMRSTGSLQHPRDYGVYAKVLGRYVRDMQILRLEEAIRKMTSLPAQFLGLKDRGLLREGYWADIVCFNPETVEERSTFANPAVHPEGIPYVLVNGQVVISEGKHTGALPGKVLFHNL